MCCATLQEQRVCPAVCKCKRIAEAPPYRYDEAEENRAERMDRAANGGAWPLPRRSGPVKASASTGRRRRGFWRQDRSSSAKARPRGGKGSVGATTKGSEDSSRGKAAG